MLARAKNLGISPAHDKEKSFSFLFETIETLDGFMETPKGVKSNFRIAEAAAHFYSGSKTEARLYSNDNTMVTLRRQDTLCGAIVLGHLPIVQASVRDETDIDVNVESASYFFRIFLAIIAKFGLETSQIDAVNVFVHAHLDESGYIKPPPDRTSSGNVIKLNKALYGLRRSPVLWQKAWTAVLKEGRFTEIADEPCVIMRGGIICFFFVDNSVFVYRGKAKKEVDVVIAALHLWFKLTEMGPVSWFSGMNVLRDRSINKTVALTKGVHRVDFPQVSYRRGYDEDRQDPDEHYRRAVAQGAKKTLYL